MQSSEVLDRPDQSVPILPFHRNLIVINQLYKCHQRQACTWLIKALGKSMLYFFWFKAFLMVHTCFFFLCCLFLFSYIFFIA
jgi:hypothetical protein